MYGMRLQRSFISACRELAKLKKETEGEELPVLNRFLYLKEDADRMEKKLEAMDASCDTGLRPVRERVDDDKGSSSDDEHRQHGPEARVTGRASAASATEPNEATAEAKSWPSRTLSLAEATAAALA